MFDDDIKEILERRKSKDAHFGHIKPECCQTVLDLVIIKRRSLYGIAYEDGKFLCSPVYDNIEVVGNGGLLILSVSDKIALFSVKDKLFVSDFGKGCIIVNGGYESVEFVLNGKHGLWDNIERRVVIPPEYIDVTCQADNQFLWVYNGSYYCFIEKQTGRVVNVSSATDVYDTNRGMLIVYGETGNVVALDNDGFQDRLALRRLVVANRGRLTLRNSKKNIKDIIDVYGRILNR